MEMIMTTIATIRSITSPKEGFNSYICQTCWFSYEITENCEEKQFDVRAFSFVTPSVRYTAHGLRYMDQVKDFIRGIEDDGDIEFQEVNEDGSAAR